MSAEPRKLGGRLQAAHVKGVDSREVGRAERVQVPAGALQPIAALPGVRELHIGHSIVSHAVFTGLRAAVAEMKKLMREAAAGGADGGAGRRGILRALGAG